MANYKTSTTEQDLEKLEVSTVILPRKKTRHDAIYDTETGNSFDQAKEFSSDKALQQSPALNEDVSGCFDVQPIQTSTPDTCRSTTQDGRRLWPRKNPEPKISPSSSFLTYLGPEETGEDVQRLNDESFEHADVPILGYETIEERAKFTIFKLEVRKSSYESWFIFRRYSDFERLKRQLKRVFPDVHLKLPPKKWIGDNFDTVFLGERLEGLQAFVNKIVSNKDVCSSAPVRQFFCFDEPPGPYESLEESRAICESLEDQVYRLTLQLQEKDNKIEEMQTELNVCKEKITEMERSSCRSIGCSCCDAAASLLKRQQEVDSNENLTPQL